MKKPCILVVDDDTALRELITLRLEANGFRVEAVDSGVPRSTSLIKAG